MPEFRVDYVIGEPPAEVADRLNAGPAVAMVAPRPLYGDPVKLDPTWGWVGQVILSLPDLTAATENHRLDASVVRWVDRAQAIAEARAHLEAEYGADEVAAVDPDDNDLLCRWVELHDHDRVLVVEDQILDMA